VAANEQQVAPVRPHLAAARAQLARNRLRRNQPVRNNVRTNENVNDDNDDDDDDQEGNLNQDNIDQDDEQTLEEREELRKRVGTKKLLKMEEKAARKERNEVKLISKYF
jgi:hypothetical protein